MSAAEEDDPVLKELSFQWGRKSMTSGKAEEGGRARVLMNLVLGIEVRASYMLGSQPITELCFQSSFRFFLF